jgi:hypothetical protein
MVRKRENEGMWWTKTEYVRMCLREIRRERKTEGGGKGVLREVLHERLHRLLIHRRTFLQQEEGE